MRSALFIDRLGGELHGPFKSKPINTCDDKSRREMGMDRWGLATLTTGGTSAMVARKSQMRPLQTSACQVSRLARSVDNPPVSTSDVPDRKRRVH